MQPSLLARMSEVTRPGGLVIASFWQFAELDRYVSRRIDWSEAVAAGWLTPACLEDLDQGDWLLRWGGTETLRARYCRATDQIQARAVVAGGETSNGHIEWFRADGRTEGLNLYSLMERPSDDRDLVAEERNQSHSKP